MLFTNGTYYIFLIVIFFAYWWIAHKVQGRVALLLAANLFFYALTGGRGLWLLLALSLLDFTNARWLSQAVNPRRRKILLALSLLANLGALSFFKYANFFIAATASALSGFGFSIAPSPLHLLAPLGISFFVFQSIAYVVDVYRGDVKAAENYGEYLAFISFFPTLLAGPILRVRQLLPQLRGRLNFDATMGSEALFLIALGLIKKIAIADYLGANFVDRVFDFPERFSALENLAAIYGYALQIYTDFSGYSDIAIGSALLLGLRLPQNFNAPYLAKDLPEFWRRWHISLSTWLRDYVFFSLAGRRSKNSARLYGGLVVTMLIGGLWHGASGNFVAWGALHGAGLVGVRWLAALRKRFGLATRDAVWSRALGVFITFHFVGLAWMFFRAESFAQAFAVLHQLATFTTDTANLGLPVALLIALGLLAHAMPDRAMETLRNGFIRLPALAQAALLFALANGLYLVASTDVVPFVYTRF
ncbi:MAG: MBOAT family protein [Acidobacteria bacterium]|nr:MBOAT family protein [Acidobacteriota bacterium]